MTPNQSIEADQSGADERAKFEAWHKGQFSSLDYTTDAEGNYIDELTQLDWERYKRCKKPTASSQPAPQYYVIDHDDVRNIIDDLKSGVISANAICTLEGWLQEGTVATPQPSAPALPQASGDLPELQPVAWSITVGKEFKNSVCLTHDKTEAELEFEEQTENGVYSDIYTLHPLYAAPPTQAIAEGAVDRNDSMNLDIGRALQRAAEHLPELWQLSIEVEQGCGSVELCDPEGSVLALNYEGQPFADQINAHTDYAIEQSQGAKHNG